MVEEMARRCGVEFEMYGGKAAKVEPLDAVRGKLVLVTAITPTSAGEGKTTTAIGLSDALCQLGKKSYLALREPSLGPVFGVKGGACGGGKSKIVPEEEINLHFTGDFHAVTSAHNLLSAMIDNHLHFGNSLCIEPRSITWPRVLDCNDRALRRIIVGLGSVIRESRFEITAASEIMAILCLTDIADLRDRLSRIVIGKNFSGQSVTAGELKAVGAMEKLLQHALKPNLVQTLEGNPALVHGGPFANIAHGCNTLLATKTALSLGEYVVTEAGFGSDLGAEKFFDIKCRVGSLKPNCAVLVVSLRALAEHGGTANLEKHIANLKQFGVPVVVALNEFATDRLADIENVKELSAKCGVRFARSRVYLEGGKGGIDLAKQVIDACDDALEFKYLYDLNWSLKSKIEVIAKQIYGAKGVKYSARAESEIAELDMALPVCMAKTPLSLSDDSKLKGAPTGFEVTVRGVKLSAGAGFIVVYLGDVMTMPGLPRIPRAESM